MRIGTAVGVSDTGRRRLRNEDAFICAPPLFAVADGMGGARAGEIAAGQAVAALEEAGEETRGDEGIRSLIAEANRRIWERAASDPATAGMGTTVTAALVDAASGTVTIGHVGDSRGYRVRDGAIEQITTDHSLVAELVESGMLTPEEAEHHPQRSAITRALGTEPTVEVDAFTVAAEPGDVFLLSSDGLSTMLGEDEIAAIIDDARDDLGQAAEALVAAANANGGEDNVTVVLFELQAGEPDRVETVVSSDGAAPETEAPEAGGGDSDSAVEPGDPPAAPAERPRRHGAGPGGRLAAILLLAAVVGVGLLVLYWGVVR